MRQFWRLFASLPIEVQGDAKRAYGLFRLNPSHPSLHFKKLAGEEAIYSSRIGLGYRALGVMKEIASSGIGSEARRTTIV
jgi:hypothetical protein